MKCKICGNNFKVSYFLQKVCNDEDCKIAWAISVVKKTKKNKLIKKNNFGTKKS